MLEFYKFNKNAITVIQKYICVPMNLQCGKTGTIIWLYKF